MTPLWLALALLSPSPELPSLGLLRTAAGWRELIGFRGNFLWHSSAEAPAESARWRIRCGPATIAWDGGAGLVGVTGEPLALACADGRLVALTRESTGRLWWFDPVTLEPRGTDFTTQGDGPATLDATAALWTASGPTAVSGDSRWTLPAAITALHPMQDGWVIAQTTHGWHILRRGDPVVYWLPNP
jgi:hypothetical protein